ncbi:hypothetical protein J7M22_11450 [Candidatus Poribacteria bacterium]|nr:hypothetical protein [Candidatus Poribacteria bacterium]
MRTSLVGIALVSLILIPVGSLSAGSFLDDAVGIWLFDEMRGDTAHDTLKSPNG